MKLSSGRRKASKNFHFRLGVARTSKLEPTSLGQSFGEWFFSNYGELKVASEYKITVEVVK